MRTPSVAGASAVTGAVCGSALTSGLGRMSQAAAAADTGLSLRSTSSFRDRSNSPPRHQRGGRAASGSLLWRIILRGVSQPVIAVLFVCRGLCLVCMRGGARRLSFGARTRLLIPLCGAFGLLARLGCRRGAGRLLRLCDRRTWVALVVAGTRLRIDQHQAGQSCGGDDRQFSSMRHRILPSPRRWMRHITRFSDGLTLTQMGNCHAIRGRNAAVRGRAPR